MYLQYNSKIVHTKDVEITIYFMKFKINTETAARCSFQVFNSNIKIYAILKSREVGMEASISLMGPWFSRPSNVKQAHHFISKYKNNFSMKIQSIIIMQSFQIYQKS